MLRLSHTRAVVASVLCAPWLAASFPIAPAMAQVVKVSSIGGGGGPMGAPTQPEVASTHIDKYADMLALTDDQKAALKDMHQTFLNEQAAAAALMQQAIDDAKAEADESGQFDQFMKVMGSARETYNKSAGQAKQRLFDDLHLLLTPEQEQHWPEVERTRRRVESVGRGAMSGESVDLVQLVDDLKFPSVTRDGLTPVLGAYEVSFDTALAERTAKQEALKAKMAANQDGPLAFVQNDDLNASLQDASVHVRDVNVTFARQISDTLPPDLKEQFDTEFQKRSFPQVYAPTYAERALDTAMTFEDLTPEQRTQIQALEGRLSTEVDAANQRWADAIRADETDPNTNTLISEQFGMPMQIRMGEEAPALQEARQARSELMSNYLDQVRALLSPEQQARLPKREPAQRAVGAGGVRTMVIGGPGPGPAHAPSPAKPSKPSSSGTN